MATIAQIRKRIELAEAKTRPGADIPPFHIIDPSRQTQAEIDAIRAEVDEYERRNPYGVPAFIIELAYFGDE